MQYQIVTFGNGEAIKGVLDAIVMCMNTQTGTLYEPMIRISMIFGGFWAALYSIWGDYLKAWGRTIIPFVLIPPLLFIPTATVNIHDVVSHYRDRVDNVPYGLACVTHFITQIGYEITRQVDRVFADVDDLKYHKSGFLMASNLIQQARTFRITNEDIAENMRQFVCQCIAYDAMLGRKYTIEDLRNTDDIWGLVSANASPIRAFIWREPHKPGEAGHMPEIVTCRDGVRRFNQIWGGELDRSKFIYGKKLFGHTSPLTSKSEFLKYLPVSYGFLTGLSKSADQILQQQMMIYSVVDGIEQKSTALGNAPNFAARRAYLQQRTTYETLGSMASETLMMMKSVLETVVYAGFIFLVPLSLLPFGVTILLSWVQLLLWLQMWAPLYAVLNFIVTLAARSKSLGMLATSNPDGITIASSVGLMNANADMAAMAGYLAISIPFLAVALVKGVGSFVHMSSHLGNVSQGAASQAAGDAVSGNYNFGNITEGNQQISNTNMMTYSRAASYRAGSFQLIDGRAEITTMADGSQVANVGVSKLPVTLNGVETVSDQMSEASGQVYQRGLSQTESSAQSLSNSYRNLVTLSDNLSKSESMNDGMSQGATAEQSRSIDKTSQLMKRFADENNMDIGKAADLFGAITAGGGAFVNVSFGGKASVTASDRELLQKAKVFMDQHDFKEAERESMQATKNLSHTLSDESSRRLASDVSGSYEKGMNERHEASKSFSESESLQIQSMNMRSNAASINAQYDQQFMEWLAQQPRDNTNGGHIGMRGAIDMATRDINQVRAYGAQFMREHKLMPNTPLNTNPSQIKSAYHAEQRHQVHKATDGYVNEVKQQGSSEFNNDHFIQGRDMREESSRMIHDNSQSITQQERIIKDDGSNIVKKVTSQEGQYVTVRAFERMVQEGEDSLSDLKKIRNRSGKGLEKIHGEPQQK
jgi:conjugal transfer mating pair stabilization protein TraG